MDGALQRWQRWGAVLSMFAHCNGNGSGRGGATQLMGVRWVCAAKAKAVGGGTALLMVRCNGNGGGGAVQSKGMCCNGKDSGNGSVGLSIGTDLNGNGGGDATLLMVCCNRDSGGGTTLLVACCKSTETTRARW